MRHVLKARQTTVVDLCHKWRYESRPVAKRDAKRINRLRGWSLRVYGCTKCQGYHLTSWPASVGR